jgi:hypothetical protein
MLSEDKIIALYCIVDDMLKGLHHYEDIRIEFSDAEVITTAFVAVLCFGGHLDNARSFMKRHVSRMLGKSRLCRRLHRLRDLPISMFYQLGKDLKDMAGATEYRLDSFPVAVCDTIQINRSKDFKKRTVQRKTCSCAQIFL